MLETQNCKCWQHDKQFKDKKKWGKSQKITPNISNA